MLDGREKIILSISMKLCLSWAPRVGVTTDKVFEISVFKHGVLRGGGEESRREVTRLPKP